MRLGVSQHAREINFQACSFNHSDISPSLESTTCERSRTDYRHAGVLRNRSSILFAFNGLRTCDNESPQKCVRPLNVSRRLTAISLRWGTGTDGYVEILRERRRVIRRGASIPSPRTQRREPLNRSGPDPKLALSRSFHISAPSRPSTSGLIASCSDVCCCSSSCGVANTRMNRGPSRRVKPSCRTCVTRCG